MTTIEREIDKESLDPGESLHINYHVLINGDYKYSLHLYVRDAKRWPLEEKYCLYGKRAEVSYRGNDENDLESVLTQELGMKPF